MKQHKYTWRPDLPDHRDHIYVPQLGVAHALPPAVDLRGECSAVEDQGQLGSCTANAAAGALEFLELKDGKSVKFADISRLFIYYNERAIEGTIDQDAGAQIRDGVKSLNKTGAAAEKLWPYVTSKFKQKPTAAAFKDAGKRKISSYGRITTLYAMKACLAAGFPFIFGFSVYELFESAQVAKTGILDLPASGEQLLGGHAVLCVGYDDSSDRVIVRNSWGKSWGQAGYFTMPYAYISNDNLADDMWTIRKGAEL